MHPTFDNGLARIRTGNREGATIHLVRPPYGHGLACDPLTAPARMIPVPDATAATCKVCLAAQAKGKVTACSGCYRSEHRCPDCGTHVVPMHDERAELVDHDCPSPSSDY